ncbi:MAG: T9SS type B sorting domain-containing protein [Flavobacteriaceae bacterium]|nr:T9SS type B sorting domain-containing protein [Flavobacteriaceae bacterium]
MKKQTYILLIISLTCINIIFSQKILIDNTQSAQELIENNLVEGCVEVSNISSSVNGSINGFSSFGFFERANSNFPFQNGIVLSTGNANSGGNTTNTNILNEGETNWGTDPDLETALGITNTLNATSIEFDFISISNLIQFNYILASEEYFGNFPCEYSDGFAFLIRQAGTNDPYTNIALIPGTNIPVNTNTIHDEIVGFCAAENDQYFDGYSMGDTNYNGRTTVLSATANIVPNVQYHIKLIIADQTDENYDSAVFIQGNSFNATVDLGSDITTCAESYELNGDIQNPLATYAWYQDGILISGETNPTLTVTASGNYTVEISIILNNINCVIEDSVIINLSSEQTATVIADYQLCDDSSGDGIETFNLSIKDSEVLNAVSPGNYSFSYHLTDTDAQNNTNAITNPIQNSSNPQTIYVRIEDTNGGCLAYTNFNLVVNPLPQITAPTPIVVCDDAIADGSTQIDLTQADAEITQGDTNLIVSYHYTQNDADNGNNPIPSPYVNTLPNEQLFVRVQDSTTDCYSTTTISITVLDRPNVNINIPPLNACDSDNDGFAFFDLTTVISDILQGLTGVTVTFHVTNADAQTGNNPVANASNFQNTIADVQTIYVRIVDDITGCATIVPIAIHTNLLITGTAIQNFYVCDDDSGDGIAEFDLLDIASQIINNLADVTVAFYETQFDLDNSINPIDQNVPYVVTSSPKLIYIRIGTATCAYEAEINLFINPPIILQSISPIDYCDTDDDGIMTLDLSTFDAIVRNGLTGVTVNYFINDANANNNVNALPQTYTNTANPQTLYARVTSNTTSCYNTIAFDVNVIPAPTVNSPLDIIICDDDQDAFYIVNLDAMIPNIVANTTDLVISFHTTLNDQQNNTNPILVPNAFNATTQTIYTRVESTITGCFASAEINIIVNTLPEFIPISNFENCESDGDQTADFLFNLKDTEILNNQTGKQVLYFETENDAINRTNIIDKNSNYSNTSSPQTIYVRVENFTDQECYGVSSFVIEVGSIPIFNAPTNYIICDDISNDGFEVFDLNEKITEISQGSPENLSITFYTSFNDAENALNEISLEYTNIDNPQQIYVRIENGTYCHAIAEFGLNVIQVPTVNLPSALVTCDSDYDGVSTFDLTVSEFEILDIRNDDIVISYFETEEDLEANTNPIQNPENYNNISNPQTVYVKITNVISNCHVALSLDLSINLPPAINDIPSIEICDNEASAYDLAEATNILIDDLTDVNVSYYLNIVDAENAQNAIGDTYNYNSDSVTLFIRAENSNTFCFIVSSFNLIVNLNPIANTPPNLEDCDDDYDLELIFDLSQQTATVLGNQNVSQFTVTYYENENDVITGENEIQDLIYNAFNGQIIYVRIEHNITGCFDTTLFTTIVNRKPFVDIPDQVVCLDNLPLTVFAVETVEGDSYLWSTNAITSEIEITEIGEYSVTVTTPLGCQTTTIFNVIESEPAIIEFTETVDFSDPNNITITVSGIGNYQYVLDDGEPQESNFFENVSIGPHTITVIDLNGCDSTTKDLVIIDTPHFVTPNGDGYFDTWHISGVDQLVGTTINIFDRYGKQLAFLTHTSQGWNGNYNGHKMPANDYWFVANVVNGDLQFQVKGHFALRR